MDRKKEYKRNLHHQRLRTSPSNQSGFWARREFETFLVAPIPAFLLVATRLEFQPFTTSDCALPQREGLDTNDSPVRRVVCKIFAGTCISCRVVSQLRQLETIQVCEHGVDITESGHGALSAPLQCQCSCCWRTRGHGRRVPEAGGIHSAERSSSVSGTRSRFVSSE